MPKLLENGKNKKNNKKNNKNIDCFNAEVINDQFSVQDVDTVKASGDPKIAEVMTLNEKVMGSTSQRGQEVLQRERENLGTTWETLLKRLIQVDFNVI